MCARKSLRGKVRSGCFCYCAAHGLVVTAQNPKGPRGPCRCPVPPKCKQPLVLLVHAYQLSCCCCSLAQSCPTLCSHTDCSTPGLPVHHQLLGFTQTHVHWVSDAILCCPLLLPPSIFPRSGSFQMSQFFTSGGQSIGVSASASVLPVNIQD